MHSMYMLVLLSDHVFSHPKIDGFGHQLWELIRKFCNDAQERHKNLTADFDRAKVWPQWHSPVV